ncbi:hypothetical protein [Micromonospora sp. NPDC005087]|uniref:hypothetical protein n=1 Tax=Micromonospora sp. NPDC005087 TaxID=3364225 RepID=UPI003675D56E
MHDPQVTFGCGVLVREHAAAAAIGADQQPPVGIGAPAVDQRPDPEGAGQGDGQFLLPLTGGVGELGVTDEGPPNSSSSS